MTLGRAIDRWLEWGQLERDWTPRTIRSYRGTLDVLADAYPDHEIAQFDGRTGTDLVRTVVAQRWGATKASTRATRLAAIHSFFSWCEDEGLLTDDPARRIKSPPRRRADVYRPPTVDRQLARSVTTLAERPAWILMDDLGLRASSVVRVRWRDVDLTRGRISVYMKGNHRDVLPIPPWTLTEMRELYRLVQPDHDDHVFAPEVEIEDGNRGRKRVRTPKVESKTKTLWEMTTRVCKRAGVRPFGPHALRHGMATDFLRETRRDVYSLRDLMRHASVGTTEKYADELKVEELEDVLQEIHERRQASATSVAETGDEEPDVLAASLDDSSGPGWNRTTGPAGASDEAGTDRAEEADEPPLDRQKGRHKVEGDA